MNIEDKRVTRAPNFELPEIAHPPTFRERA
jgi:hypothetical protein